MTKPLTASTKGRALIWFRRDLRLRDNPALNEAVHLGLEIIPIYIWSPQEEAPWPTGSASKVYLHHRLSALNQELGVHGSRLIIREGMSLGELNRIIQQTQAQFVFWNRLYDPSIVKRDEEIKADLKRRSVDARSFKASLLFEPWEVQTGQQRPYQVFTPYWNSCLKIEEIGPPLREPKQILNPTEWPPSLSLDQLSLLPTHPRWDSTIEPAWTYREDLILQGLQSFLKRSVATYSVDRDFPFTTGTSRLSAALHFGAISPRQIWHHTKLWMKTDPSATAKRSAHVFLKEIGWREFAHHILFHFPQTQTQSLRSEFNRFPWKTQAKTLRAWQRGETGVPIVDAGMRELWKTGYMHNRVRMIVASFLTKHLLTSWMEGARWFWETLVDADLANNNLGWQWAGGCGADAAPYFRIFNPVLQGERFDPHGDYVKLWVPELKALPPKLIHKPWATSLGLDYPSKPIIDLQQGRERALETFATHQRKAKIQG